MIETVTRIMVNSRYFPSRGTANEVGGIISASRRKNTVSDTRIEIHSVTCNDFKDHFIIMCFKTFGR